MNNVAAGLTAYAGLTLGAFAVLGRVFDVEDPGLLVACFISSALVAHLFGEAITCTYVGIPAEDVVSVLPAHRLAKAGLGAVAVRASADGALAGLVLSSILLIPLCCVMGWPLGLYPSLRKIMGVFMILLSARLIVAEGYPRLRTRVERKRPIIRILKASLVFLAAGLLGCMVLSSRYYSAPLPDLPWLRAGFVSPSSLLLPLFAGLFGIPSLVLSMGSRRAYDVQAGLLPRVTLKIGSRDFVLTMLGGSMVGWMPGMTSGSSVSVCAPNMQETSGDENVRSSCRFIWLYSSISASGTVFALGALFVILRARSGSMDAVSAFLGSVDGSNSWLSDIGLMLTILFSMLVAAVISRWAIDLLMTRLSNLGRVLCSRELAITSLAFVCSLSTVLTGTRGALVMFTAAMLGLLPPLIGVRRIQLMGCLLVPISIMFIENMMSQS